MMRSGVTIALLATLSFGSGIHHASHVMVTCAVANEATEPPRTIACYFARAEVRVIDNWHVSGLRGTGLPDVIGDAQRIAASVLASSPDPVRADLTASVAAARPVA